MGDAIVLDSAQAEKLYGDQKTLMCSAQADATSRPAATPTLYYGAALQGKNMHVAAVMA